MFCVKNELLPHATGECILLPHNITHCFSVCLDCILYNKDIRILYFVYIYLYIYIVCL